MPVLHLNGKLPTYCPKQSYRVFAYIWLTDKIGFMHLSAPIDSCPPFFWGHHAFPDQIVISALVIALLISCGCISPSYLMARQGQMAAQVVNQLLPIQERANSKITSWKYYIKEYSFSFISLRYLSDGVVYIYSIDLLGYLVYAIMLKRNFVSDFRTKLAPGNSHHYFAVEIKSA
jgi:hypothetical protein